MTGTLKDTEDQRTPGAETLTSDFKKVAFTWNEAKTIAKGKRRWNDAIAALYPTRDEVN